MLRPACYQDLVDGRQVFEKAATCLVEVDVQLPGRHCPSNMAGESYLLNWSTKGASSMGSSQGHVFVRRFRDETSYRTETQGQPRLYVQADSGAV
jgi:hypothetical protein